MAESDDPTTPIRNGSRPARRASAATSSGNAPAPQAPRPARSRFFALAVARHADRPVAALAQEGDDLLHRLLVREGLGDVAEALLQRALAEEQHAIGAPELVDRLMREAAPLEADEVEAGERGAIAERHAEWDEIVLDAGEAADKGVGADANVLMRRRAAADDGEVADRDMARQHHIVGQNDALADPAVVRDMGVGEEHGSRTDDRHRPAAFGARVHRHVLADQTLLADDETDRLASILEVL